MTRDSVRTNACECSKISRVRGGKGEKEKERKVCRRVCWKGRQVCLRNKCESVWVQIPPPLMRLIMRIEREKRIRREYVGEKVKKIVGQIVRSVTGVTEEGKQHRVSYCYGDATWDNGGWKAGGGGGTEACEKRVCDHQHAAHASNGHAA